MARVAATRVAVVTDYETEREENTTALLTVWPDIEQAVLDDPEMAEIADAMRRAFRVEAAGTRYRLLYNVEDRGARAAAALFEEASSDYGLDPRFRRIMRKLTPGIGIVAIEVRLVSERKPIEVEWEVCPRVMSTPIAAPDLEELPNPEPEGSTVPLIERDHHWLTPIEAPFYDELVKTDLTFAVQPWIAQHDRRYRVDFIVFWGGRSIVVELDGHEGHKSKAQRQHDYKRERWLQSHGLSVVRWTGSDVYADAAGCVRYTIKMLRGDEARA